MAIARNLLRAECERIQRRARNEQNHLDHLLAEQSDRSARKEPGALAARAQFLADWVPQLKKEAQALLALRYCDGQRVQAIARQLGRSGPAVSVQLFTVRKLLRDGVRRKLVHAPLGLEPEPPNGPA